ncbi:unnamed protein product [Leptidea sinapis]|uniref:Uncharacterized protein n=1 Tax=Leptidea sinapis TaxID=189913 RepID=A0A5E4PPR5_9NEOP|nr:unnamed protein product [Leptidea sinapis]
MEQPVQGQPPNAAGMVQGPPNDDRGEVERGGRDDSDGSAEDNVTVTVPPRAAHVTSGVNAPRPRHADMSNGARGHYGRSSRYGPGPRSQGMEGPNVTDGQRHHITEVRLTTCRGCHRRITMHHLEDRLAIMNSTRRTTSINHLRLGSKIRPMRAVRTRWRLSIE